jgi:lysophospholipase L1-like esterase
MDGFFGRDGETARASRRGRLSRWQSAWRMAGVAALAVNLGALSGCGAASDDEPNGSDERAAVSSAAATTGQWVDTWASGRQLVETANLPPAPGLNGNTLRQVVRASVGGSFLKIQLSNEFGSSPVTMDAVHIAVSRGGGAIDTTTDTKVLFSGVASVTIPAGQQVFSDGFSFNLAALSDVAITIHFASQSGNVTGHPGSRATSFIARGNAVSAASLPSPVTVQHWYYLTNLNSFVATPGGTLIAFGDSITDGRGSTTDGNNRWPDDLARRLHANAATVNVGVGNEGIGGNAVVSGGLGPTGSSRFAHDVVGQRNPRWVIVLEGVNDIGGSTSQQVATNLINAYQQMITQAHQAGIRAYGVPILPFGGSSFDTADHQASRQTVNNFIRTSGKFDAVIDLDAVVLLPRVSPPSCDAGRPAVRLRSRRRRRRWLARLAGHQAVVGRLGRALRLGHGALLRSSLDRRRRPAARQCVGDLVRVRRRRAPLRRGRPEPQRLRGAEIWPGLPPARDRHEGRHRGGARARVPRPPRTAR